MSHRQIPTVYPSIAARQFTSLLLIHFFITLLSRSGDTATTEQLHTKILDCSHQNEPTSFNNFRTQPTDNKIDQNAAQQTPAVRHHYWRVLCEQSLRAYQQQQQPVVDKIMETSFNEVYKAVEQNYQHPISALHLPEANNRSPEPTIGQASHSPLSTQSSEIVYAPDVQPLGPTGNRLNCEKQTAPLNSRLDRLAVTSASTAFSATHQHKGHCHSCYSSQGNYAPKRRPVADTQSAHEKLLPYPPSFISITSTSTTVPPPLDAWSKNVDYSGRGVKPVPDIFVTRQHKSLLDSYIPSWVMARMLQQHKWLQQKQLYKFVATHTLAFPIMKKSA